MHISLSIYIYIYVYKHLYTYTHTLGCREAVDDVGVVHEEALVTVGSRVECSTRQCSNCNLQMFEFSNLSIIAIFELSI